jgi:hypothetical protein
METQLKITPYDRWIAGNDRGPTAMSACQWQEAPKERNQIARGIVYSLPISALLWCALLAMLLHR